MVPLDPGHIAGLVRMPFCLAVIAKRVATSGPFAAEIKLVFLTDVNHNNEKFHL